VSGLLEHDRDTSSAVVIAVIAGGKSLRMGSDKASLIIGGVTMLERVTSEALRTGCPVVVIGRSQPDAWSLQEIQFLPDETPGLGPLGGLATGLRFTGTSLLAIACDMPLVTTGAIHWLLEAMNHSSGEDGIVITIGGEPEPLFSIYHRSCLPQIEQQLASGRRSVKGLIDQGRFACCEAPEWVAMQLLNVNTPGDLDGLMG
jgi:molybdenum cofactor guanylyltransferase